jgi:transposase
MSSRRLSHPVSSKNSQKFRKIGRPKGSVPLTNIEKYNTQLYFEQVERENKELEEKRVENLFDSLKKPSGKQFSLEENRFLLVLIKKKMDEMKWSKTESIDYYSSMLEISHNTLHSLWNSFLATEKVPEPDTSNCGAGSPLHSNHSSALTLDIECAIHRIIQNYNKNNGFCSTPMIVSSLFNELGVNVPIATMKGWLHELNYQFGRSRTYGPMELSARKARTVDYIKQLSLAKKLEDSDNYLICYMDESYVNLNHKIQYTWYSKKSEIGNEVGGKPGKGERAIIIHAITKFGLLGGEIDNNNLGEIMQSSQHIFTGGYIGEDYHKNMNSDLFINWINNRFISSFNHAFPGKKCVLILDNASYHHTKCDKFLSLSGNKKELINELEKTGISSFNVVRKNRILKMDKIHWGKAKSLISPTSLEIKHQLGLEIQKNPQNQISKLKEIFDPLGWKLVYTPPYTPETQPIEKVWAFVKNYVAKHYNTNEKMNDLIVEIKRGFYGFSDENHPGVTPQLCSNIINHCLSWCNDFIDKNMHPGGNLSSLANYLNENTEEIIPNLDNSILIDAEREEEEEKNRDIFDFPSDDD